jgi:hypothetical protein
MLLHSKFRPSLIAMLFVLVASVAWQGAHAQDMAHDISGVVKKIDKGTKTVVIKAADGTEHTIKYTDDTAVEGAKDAGKGMDKGAAESYLAAKKGAKVTVHYTAKGADKIALGVKDAVD